MSLDFTAPGRYNPEPHFRRYLDGNSRIVVVCVQDFDYCDYDTDGFIDSETFATEAEAKAAPINVGPLIQLAEADPLSVTAHQALRIIRAALRTNGVVA